MSSHDLNAVEDFFRRFDALQLETWSIKLNPDTGRVAAIKQEMKLDALTEGKAKDMVKVLARPSRPDDAWFAQHGARDVGTRTVHAIQAVHAGGEALAWVYTNAFERNELGMNERFAVGTVDGALLVISHQTRCGECGGSGCGVCKQQGWRHAGGRTIGASEPTGQVKKIEAPTHSQTAALYEAMA
jgi:hypothetical protein